MDRLPLPHGRGSDSSSIQDIARHRRTDPRSLARQLRGDLDWIVLKCLEKERTRRYETANGLAADLQRHLSDEPVEASPPSAAYKFRKFAKRNRAALVTTGVVVASLVLGLTLAVYGLIQATHQRQRAQAEAVRTNEQRRRAEANFQKAREAVDHMLTEVGQKDLADVPGMEPVRRALLNKALGFYQSFLEERSSEPAIRFETAMAYSRVGGIQIALGAYDEAEQAYRGGITLLEDLVTELPDQAAYRLELAYAQHNLASGVLKKVGRRDDAEQAYRQARAVYEQLAVEFPEETNYRNFATTLRGLGTLLGKTGRLSEAKETYEEAFTLLKKRLVADAPNQAECRRALIETYADFAQLHLETGSPEEAEDWYRQAVALAEALVADVPENVGYRHSLATQYNNLGVLLIHLRRLEGAENAFRSAINLNARLADDFPAVLNYARSLARNHMNLGLALELSGRTEEAETAYRRAVDLYAKLAGDYPQVPTYRFELARVHNNLGSLLRTERRFGEAEEAYRLAAEIQEGLVAEFPAVSDYRSELSSTYMNLGIVFAQTGRAGEAADAFRKSVESRETLVSEFPDMVDYRLHLGEGLSSLALLLRIVGRFEDSETAFGRALALWKKLSADAPTVPYYRQRLADSLEELGILLVADGRDEEAAEVFNQGLAAWDSLATDYPKRHEYQRRLAWFLAMCLDPQFRDPDRALELAKKAVELARQDGESWQTLGVARYRAGNWQDTFAALEKSMELRNGGESVERFFTAMAHWQLGSKDQARQWYDQGVRWIEENNPAEDWHARYRAEAAELLGIEIETPNAEQRESKIEG